MGVVIPWENTIPEVCIATEILTKLQVQYLYNYKHDRFFLTLQNGAVQIPLILKVS